MGIVMSIRIKKTYQYGQYGERFLVLDLDEANDKALTVSLGVQTIEDGFKQRTSAKAEPTSLTDLNNKLDVGTLIHVDTLPPDIVEKATLTGKSQEKAQDLEEAFDELVHTDPFELCGKKTTELLRPVAAKLGCTLVAAALMWTKILQSGMLIAAIFPRWSKCGRHPAVTDDMHCKAKPTKQPMSFPLSLQEIARMIKTAKKHQDGTLTWEELHNKHLKEYHTLEYREQLIKGKRQLIPLYKKPGKRPSLGQFYRHTRAALGYVKLKELQVGKGLFERDHAGKPVGQKFTALQGGRLAEVDWTTTGLVTVRRGNRTSVGTLTVYVIVDVFTGMILSIYLTMGKGSVEEAGRAILVCLEDKVELCRRYGIPIEAHEWAAKHIPVYLSCDRGEFNSWKASSFVSGLGIKLRMVRSKFAKDKGTVESFNAKIKAELRALPGGVNIFKKRTKPNPHELATLDFDQVYSLLLSLAVLHNATPREHQPLSEGMVAEKLHECPTPNRLWDYAERHGMLRETTLEEARPHALPHDEAAITERGIQFEGLRFKVPNFKPGEPGGIEANAWLAEARKERWKVDIVREPTTVDYIWLRHTPQGGPRVMLKCPLSEGQAGLSGIPWGMYRQIKANAGLKLADYRNGAYQIAAARHCKIVEETLEEARLLTEAARKGLSKAALKRDVSQNRKAEEAERAAASQVPEPTTGAAKTVTDDDEFREDYQR